jgi:CHAD domain-containing protein
VIWIEFVEPEEEHAARTSEALAVLGSGDAAALAAMEAELADLLAAAIPDDPAGSAPARSDPPQLVKKARRRVSRRRLTAPRGVPLREAMLTAFTAIIATARGTVRHVALEPEQTLHDFRKSVRRARALVALLRPALGRITASGLTGELRAAFQATGALRDADVLIATLRSVASDDPSRPIVERALAQEQSRDGARAAEALAAGNRILRPLPDVLRVTLPQAFSMDDLARGLARSCRRVRTTLERAAVAATSTEFHEWRKRVKELRYQVELLASTGSAELKRREKALAALAEELGKVTDLIVLQTALVERQSSGAVPQAPALADAIRATIDARASELTRRGVAFFTEAPADFARQVLAERG